MILIFGGSFDPPHIGHLIVARDVKEKLKAKKVIFVPAWRSPFKEGHSAPPEDRLTMVKLCTEEEDGFEVEDYEVKKGGISYTVHTLEYMRRKYGEDLAFLMGSDTFKGFPKWRDPFKILKLAKLVVVGRGEKPEEPEVFKEFIRSGRILFVNVRRLDISSTEIRERIARGISVRWMVPDPVLDYIIEKGLYLKREGEKTSKN